MNGWLAGKRVAIEGDSPAIAAAFEAAGALLVDGDADIWVHVAALPATRVAHELTHAEWRASMDAGLDRRFLGVGLRRELLGLGDGLDAGLGLGPLLRHPLLDFLH